MLKEILYGKEFEPWTSLAGSNCSANVLGTATSQNNLYLLNKII